MKIRGIWKSWVERKGRKRKKKRKITIGNIEDRKRKERDKSREAGQNLC